MSQYSKYGNRMVRKLPWLAGKKTSQAREGEGLGPKPPAVTSKAIERTLPASTSPDGNGHTRNPSSSPPIETARPAEEYMRGGRYRDDMWIMVEDEFLETAKLFTNHLHQAEYQRIRNLTKAQQAKLIKEISRPVDPRAQATAQAKKHAEAETSARKKELAIHEVTGKAAELLPRAETGEIEDDTPWLRDPQLSRLMTHSPKSSKLLSSSVGVKAKTRAAAGFKKPSAPMRSKASGVGASDALNRGMTGLAREIEMAENGFQDDDLDALPADADDARTTSGARQTRESIYTASNEAINNSREFAISTKMPEETAPSSPDSQESKTLDMKKRRIGERQNALPYQTTSSSSDFAERMARKKARKARQEKEKGQNDTRRSIRIDEIPTFLV